MEPIKIVIVGASFAGISSALTIKKFQKNAEVLLIDRQDTVGFIPSNLNRFLKGKMKTLTDHVAITAERLESMGINLLLSTEVLEISGDAKQLTLSSDTNEPYHIQYDKLILAMGSVQTSERIKGTASPGVLTSKTLAASLQSQEELKHAKHIVIVGGGYVGLEAADASVAAGKQVTLIEAFDSLAFKVYDPDIVIALEKRMKEQGVQIYKNQQVNGIQETEQGLASYTSQNNCFYSDNVLLAVSFRPNTELVIDQLKMQLDRTINVNEFLQTSDPAIYATGDLIRVPYKGTGDDYYLPLVNHAVITGRIAAMNALGLSESLPPSVRVVGSHLFGLYMGSVGLTEQEATFYYQEEIMINHLTIEHRSSVVVKLIVDKANGKLLGGQCYSEKNIFHLLDLLALAIKTEMRDQDLALQDFLYYSVDATLMPVLQEAALLTYQKRLKGAS